MNNNEIWKEMLNFPNYEVSNLGRIRRERNGRVIKQFRDANGYLRVSLWYNKRKYNKYVHRVVWGTFNFCDCEKTIDHIDGNKQNNLLGNLRCIDMLDQYVERKYTPKTNVYELNSDIKAEIQKKYNDGASYHSLAVFYKLPYNYVRTTMMRGSWKKYLKNELETD